MSRVLLLALCASLSACAGPTVRPDRQGSPSELPAAGPAAPALPAWEDVAIVGVAPPPWEYTLRDSLARPAVVAPRLSRLLEAPNEITDEDPWLARNGFERPGTTAASREVPAFFQGEPRMRVVEQPGATLAIYGAPSSGRYLLLAADGGRRAYDFGSYLHAPVAGGDAWPQDLLWAQLADGRLYVTHAHPTYAESTGGRNGYVTALDANTGELLWRSRPRVANARTFAVVDDVLATGYGFTREPDYLYVIDRFTGRVLQEASIRTAPTWILRREGRVFVRAYDADYVFALL